MYSLRQKAPRLSFEPSLWYPSQIHYEDNMREWRPQSISDLARASVDACILQIYFEDFIFTNLNTKRCPLGVRDMFNRRAHFT